MKNLTLLIVTAILAVLNVYGVQPVNERIVKLSYPSEKEKEIIDVARKVCEDVAPSYGVDVLEAGIYSIDPSEKSLYLVRSLFQSGLLTVLPVRIMGPALL